MTSHYHIGLSSLGSSKTCRSARPTAEAGGRSRWWDVTRGREAAVVAVVTVRSVPLTSKKVPENAPGAQPGPEVGSASRHAANVVVVLPWILPPPGAAAAAVVTLEAVWRGRSPRVRWGRSSGVAVEAGFEAGGWGRGPVVVVVTVITSAVVRLASLAAVAAAILCRVPAEEELVDAEREQQENAHHH